MPSCRAKNAELKALVERREAETEYLKAQTQGTARRRRGRRQRNLQGQGRGLGHKVKLRGDFATVHENIGTERDVGGVEEDAGDRYRQRIRARLGFDATVTDNVKATLRSPPGGDDPRSSNQTLGSSGTRKPIALDLAYADWRFMQGGNLVLGKQTQPCGVLARACSTTVITIPKAARSKFDRGMFFGNAYGWWLTEQLQRRSHCRQFRCLRPRPSGWA